jgi:hypothetical protein
MALLNINPQWGLSLERGASHITSPALRCEQRRRGCAELPLTAPGLQEQAGMEFLLAAGKVHETRTNRLALDAIR